MNRIRALWEEDDDDHVFFEDDNEDWYHMPREQFIKHREELDQKNPICLANMLFQQNLLMKITPDTDYEEYDEEMG